MGFKQIYKKTKYMEMSLLRIIFVAVCFSLPQVIGKISMKLHDLFID